METDVDERFAKIEAVQRRIEARLSALERPVEHPGEPLSKGALRKLGVRMPYIQGGQQDNSTRLPSDQPEGET